MRNYRDGKSQLHKSAIILISPLLHCVLVKFKTGLVILLLPFLLIIESKGVKGNRLKEKLWATVIVIEEKRRKSMRSQKES